MTQKFNCGRFFGERIDCQPSLRSHEVEQKLLGYASSGIFACRNCLKRFWRSTYFFTMGTTSLTLSNIFRSNFTGNALWKLSAEELSALRAVLADQSLRYRLAKYLCWLKTFVQKPNFPRYIYMGNATLAAWVLIVKCAYLRLKAGKF